MAEEWFEHNGSDQVCAEGHRSAIEHARALIDAALNSDASTQAGDGND